MGSAIVYGGRKSVCCCWVSSSVGNSQPTPRTKLESGRRSRSRSLTGLGRDPQQQNTEQRILQHTGTVGKGREVLESAAAVAQSGITLARRDHRGRGRTWTAPATDCVSSPPPSPLPHSSPLLGMSNMSSTSTRHTMGLVTVCDYVVWLCMPPFESGLSSLGYRVWARIFANSTSTLPCRVTRPTMIHYTIRVRYNYIYNMLR